MGCIIANGMAPLLRRRGNAEGMGWLFFGNRILITFEDQRTTTPVVFDAFPSFAGGELILKPHTKPLQDATPFFLFHL